MQGLEAGSHNLQHRTDTSQRDQQSELGVPFIWWLYGSHFWRVLRRRVTAGVLRLRGIVQRSVQVQSSLHHRLQRQGDRTASCRFDAAAVPANTAGYGILVPAAVAASWYCGHRIATSASSVATHAARNNHRLATSVATAQRGVLAVAAAAAVATLAARNRVRVAPARSSAGCGVPAVATATAHATRRCFATTRTSAGRGLRAFPTARCVSAHRQLLCRRYFPSEVHRVRSAWRDDTRGNVRSPRSLVHGRHRRERGANQQLYDCCCERRWLQLDGLRHLLVRRVHEFGRDGYFIRRRWHVLQCGFVRWHADMGFDPTSTAARRACVAPAITPAVTAGIAAE